MLDHVISDQLNVARLLLEEHSSDKRVREQRKVAHQLRRLSRALGRAAEVAAARATGTLVGRARNASTDDDYATYVDVDDAAVVASTRI
ncbi:MAG: hypothetical protein LC777_07930 [Actinobacteria bacterium]|nr:hypothetical protein [Actinomycetota bacterium]